MLTIRPFKALMPTPEKAGQIAAVPYDVVSRDEAEALAAGNPHSFLRVSRPDIEFPPDADPHADAVYQRAAENFDKLKGEVPLIRDTAASYYIYSIARGSHRQSGLVAALSADDYDECRILIHEKTRAEKEEDRTRHTMAIRAHSGPVFLVCRSSWSMDSAIQEIMGQDTPLFDVTVDNTQHQVWRVPEGYNALLTMVFHKMPALYIADGHHRAKSASRARALCRQENASHVGDEDYNRFLGVIFPHNQVRVLPYNRIVHDLNGMDSAAFLDKVKEAFDVAPTDQAVPANRGEIHMYLDDRWLRLKALSRPTAASPVDLLDVSLLQNSLLDPILGIQDPRLSERIAFIGGIRGTDHLEKLVQSGKAAVAFSMFPTTTDDLMKIAELNESMPPKSTWFEPKLLDGLLIHTF